MRSARRSLGVTGRGLGLGLGLGVVVGVVALTVLGCKEPVPPPPVARLAAVEMAEMTWTEVRDALARGDTTALVMTASVEQNGPHLSLDKHLITGRAAAVGVARALGGALVAPLLPFGRADEHAAFPGTITWSAELFQKAVRELCENLARMGFRRLLLFGDHGGNRAPLRALAEELDGTLRAPASPRGAPTLPVRVVHIRDCYEQADRELEPELVKAGLVKPGSPHSEHAGLIDSAMLLALAPDRVRPLPATRSTAELSALGVQGEPFRATAAIGRRALALLVRACTAEARARLQGGSSTTPPAP